MSKMEMSIVIGVIACACLGVFYMAKVVKMDGDRSQTVLNIRNCQQAMRGHAGMGCLTTGDPFTRTDLEQYMRFPEDIWAIGGMIEFTPGTVITPESGNPARNGDHLWLKVKAPATTNYVGRYGWDNIDDTCGW